MHDWRDNQRKTWHTMSMESKGNIRYEGSATPLEARLPELFDEDNFSPRDKEIFSRLFPNVRVGTFSIESVNFAQETEMSQSERAARRLIMQSFGYASPKAENEPGIQELEEDIPGLYVRFTPGESLASRLNALDGIKRLESIAQTEVDTSVTRADHSRHLSRIVVQTNLRLAIQQPDLYLKRVARDMDVYTRLYELEHGETEQFLLAPRGNTRNLAAEAYEIMSGRYGAQRDTVQVRALEQAIEYTKYQMVAAYLHDVFTPAWGDLFMKTKARGPGQKSVTYSEDAMLAEHIFALLATPDLKRIMDDFDMNPALLGTMIRSMAREGDMCLGGQLMKAKNKIKNQPAPIREQFLYLSDLGQQYDLDQESGTITNLRYSADRYLPGGFQHIKKRRDGNIDSRHLPLGSFEFRAGILAYAMATGMSKQQLTKRLREMGIEDPSRIYIAAEEIAIGPNLVLREVYFGETEDIRLVNIRPGDVKKAILMFNINQIWHYRSSKLATMEAYVQTFLASALYAPPGEKPVLGEQLFTGRTNDFTVQIAARKLLPILDLVRNELALGARIITRQELVDMCDEQGVLHDSFIIRGGTPGLIVLKEGTLVETSDRKILKHPEVLSIKHADRLTGQTEVDRNSLIGKLMSVREYLEGEDFFMIVPASALDQDHIWHHYESSANSRERRAILSALRSWTRPISLDQENVVMPSLQEFVDELEDLD